MNPPLVTTGLRLNLAAVLSMQIFFFGCAACSQVEKKPDPKKVIDMKKHENLFDVKIGERFRSKVDFVYAADPEADRHIRDARVGGMATGEVLVKAGMEITLVVIVEAPFGPMAWVTVSKPFVENRPAPIISIFKNPTRSGRFHLDDEIFERIQ